MLNKITSIFIILGMLGRKENKVKVLRKSKILRLQAVNQVSRPIFLDNNDDVIKVPIEKIGSYSGV